MRTILKKVAIILTLIIIPVLYLATLAQSLVLGDPSEYTFVANTLSIAHPPGYAFITLLGKLFQTFIPMGGIPWRMHLLSATAATIAALFVFDIIRTIAATVTDHCKPGGIYASDLAAVFGALTVATATNFWQHAIHANPHIITATFMAANLFFLTRWWADNRAADKAAAGAPNDKWLLVFSFSAGLGITHHPLTVFSFPAYAIFILLVRPSIWRQWRTWLKMLALALLGLSLWLYFPIRSSMGPDFGPTSMNTLDGFLDHVLGRGITEALPFYSLVEQPHRALVYWSILRLQYSLPILFLALLGLIWPLLDRFAQRRQANLLALSVPSRPLLLYGLTFLINYAFVINLRAQDIMAYALGLQLIVGLWAGIGLLELLLYSVQRLRLSRNPLLLLTAALFLMGPVLQIVRNFSLISLRDYNEGSAYVEAVFSTFAGRGEGAVLLNEWEHMTPLWYTKFVVEAWPDPADVRPEYVSTARTWLENVFDFLPGGPVYLSTFRPEIVNAGFRLRPFGPFYKVVEPGDMSLPQEMKPVSESIGELEIAGYLLPETAVAAGDYVPLLLAMRTPLGTEDFYVPVVQVGNLSFPFTTDSHLTTPTWLPGEIIVERFDFALPHDLPGGDYPVFVHLKNLSTNEDSEQHLPLGTLTVTEKPLAIKTGDLLANFRQRVGLKAATGSSNGRRTAAPWDQPLTAKPGDVLNLVLQWQSLDYAEESYTIFVHLIDQANQPIVALDYTPLGGATPTHLWIPKWLPGQEMLDPYRLEIPPDLAPGEYFVEVGLYEMVGRRRLHMSDENGNYIGDRLILGAVNVE